MEEQIHARNLESVAKHIKSKAVSLPAHTDSAHRSYSLDVHEDCVYQPLSLNAYNRSSLSYRLSSKAKKCCSAQSKSKETKCHPLSLTAILTRFTSAIGIFTVWNTTYLKWYNFEQPASRPTWLSYLLLDGKCSKDNGSVTAIAAKWTDPLQGHLNTKLFHFFDLISRISSL